MTACPSILPVHLAALLKRVDGRQPLTQPIIVLSFTSRIEQFFVWRKVRVENWIVRLQTADRAGPNGDQTALIIFRQPQRPDSHGQNAYLYVSRV